MVLVKLLLTLAICLNLSVVAFAHPGKTDSEGGHLNHNTGEYHYHHGYSAHQHSDIDGDGNLDCPYQFVDKTDSSSDKQDSSVKVNQKREILEYLVPIMFCLALPGVIWVIDEIKLRLKK